MARGRIFTPPQQTIDNAKNVCYGRPYPQKGEKNLAFKVEGVYIDNKTSTVRLPRLEIVLKKKLANKGYATFGRLKKGCRSNEGAFKSTLFSLGATEEEVAFLISIIQKGRTVPPSAPNAQ